MESEYIDIPVITRREKEILQLMAQGDNTPIIAEKLFISYHTVQNHKRNLRKQIPKPHLSLLPTLLSIIYCLLHNNIYANVLKNMQLK